MSMLDFKDGQDDGIRLVLRRYIHESIHPDCLPGMRFKIVLPTGFVAYEPTLRRAMETLRQTVFASKVRV